MPYYRKVREYNDIESRDIWEYKLKLSEEEVSRVLLHLWEMQRAEFDYYFLDENCSYQLLSLLDVAREDLHLTKEKWPIIWKSFSVALLSLILLVVKHSCLWVNLHSVITVIIEDTCQYRL